ncbi:MarR family winged helix-turn-helix transcriptional regulator [Shewanella sp. GXUN23E]|uniref:MarR family winged helix-turn-helix transcriptional regulator n=1 Tax=Shewanella sp. GXUN23E TaxID=3422498 RepID=UPI003D7D7475
MNSHDTESGLNHAIVEFYEKLSSWEHAIVREQGISLSHVHTLEALGFHGAMRMKELAEKIGVTTGTLTVQVEKLVAAGLVERLPNETDRRSVRVGLTAQGQTLFQAHSDQHHALTAELTADFSEQERGVLLSFFERMNRHF